MFLENVVSDAIDPHTLGRFWEAALGTETLTDEPEGYETRLEVPDGPVLDLGFQRVSEPSVEPQRLRFELRGGADQQALVERLLALGASRADIDEANGPGAVLADPAGNAFRVLDEQAAYVDSGPVAALSLDVAEPGRDRAFWSWLTGWVPVEGSEPSGLRHPSGRGPLLVLRLEAKPKGPGKNRTHLDIRLEPDDEGDVLAREIADRGGRELHLGWGDLPWRHFADPSGNEFCLLPARPDVPGGA